MGSVIIEKTLGTIDFIMQSYNKHRRIHVKTEASFVGQLISMSIVIGHISQTMTRSLSTDVLTAYLWDQYISYRMIV